MTTKRQKILFLFAHSSLGGGGGAQRVPATLLRHLDHERFEFHLGLIRAERGEGDEIPPGVTVHNLDCSRVRYVPPGLVKLVHRLQPDVVFSNVCHMNLAVLMSRPLFPRRTRVLIGESTTLSVYLREAKRHLWLWHALFRWAYRRAERITTLSDDMKRDLIEQFAVPPEKLVRIYNPMDPGMVRASSLLGGSPFSGKGPHLVSAGRFVREKGIDLLLDAMPRVFAAFPQARLTLLSEGPLEKELREQAQRLGILEKISFAGLQQNPWRYFKHAGLVVVPSRVDGLAYVAVESLIVGTPVVATDCPGAIREIVDESKWVVLVPPENPAALAEGIISSLRESKSNFAPPAQLAKFDLQHVVDEYTRLFQRDE